MSHDSKPNTDAPFQIAVRHFQAGEHALAEQACQAILRVQTEHVDALHMLALLHSQAGRFNEAVKCLERAIQLRPGDAVLQNNLGESYRNQERFAEAESCFQRALQLAPRFAEPHYNLGILLKQQGRYEESLAAFSRAIELRANYAKAHYNLANLLREEGRVKTAVGAYQRALGIQPDWSEAHLNLANTYSELGELDKAIEHYQRADALAPDDGDIEISLGHAFLTQGRFAEAKDCYRRDLERRPGRFLATLRFNALCPPIAESNAWIDEYQARLVEVLDEAITADWSLDAADLHKSGAEPPMALTYHGRNVLPIMSRYAALFAAKIKPLELPEHHGKPKIGIVVTHGHEGVFARCWGGIAERLSRERLDVRIVCSRAGANVLETMLRVDRSEYFVLPERLDLAAEQLSAAGFDLLHYWEIGTDSTNCFLPYFQAAPVQMTTWGWPVTTGNPCVQGYLSHRELEPTGAEQYYAEKLLRLEYLPTWYVRPQLPKKPRNREQSGFSSREHLYLCTQNLRKYHPEFDAALAEILERDPQGKLLIIADGQPRVTQLLLDRFGRTMSKVCGRVSVLPRMDREEYLNVLALADVVLDTFHFAGGANTVLDCMSVGAPLVTWPGPFHRGRWALAVYEELGIKELIADSAPRYVELACQVAGDRELHQELKSRIPAACPSLFENAKTVAEHEEVLLSLARPRG
jgi:protein O-GlcNAc transferase